MDEYRNNSEKYFTTKVGEVITCGNSMFMIWVFDGIRYREVYTVPDFMKKKLGILKRAEPNEDLKIE